MSLFPFDDAAHAPLVDIRGEGGNPYKYRAPATEDSPQIVGACAAFGVLHESLQADGYSAGRIVERLREVGVDGITVSHLHGCGLQDVANAITDASGGCWEHLAEDTRTFPAAPEVSELDALRARVAELENDLASRTEIFERANTENYADRAVLQGELAEARETISVLTAGDPEAFRFAELRDQVEALTRQRDEALARATKAEAERDELLATLRACLDPEAGIEHLTGAVAAVSETTTILYPLVQVSTGPVRVNLHREIPTGGSRFAYKTGLGDRYGRLVVDKLERVDRVGRWWQCRCDCGGLAIRSSAALNRAARNGIVQSCRECREHRASCARSGRMWADLFRRTGTVWPASSCVRLESNVARDMEVAGYNPPSVERADMDVSAWDMPAAPDPGFGFTRVSRLRDPSHSFGYECGDCLKVTPVAWGCLECVEALCGSCVVGHRHIADELTFDEIGEVMGLSRERVRQIVERALRDIRRGLRRRRPLPGRPAIGGFLEMVTA